MSATAEPVHPDQAPGWTYETLGYTYWVWGPSGERPGWSACYQSRSSKGSDFQHGHTSADVLAIFPVRVRARFQPEIEHGNVGRSDPGS